MLYTPDELQWCIEELERQLQTVTDPYDVVPCLSYSVK